MQYLNSVSDGGTRPVMALSLNTGDRPLERPKRTYRIMSKEAQEKGRSCQWRGLEIRGPIRNLSPALWTFTHLTALYLNDNSLQRIPADIVKLHNLCTLDLSGNKLRSLPIELGDMTHLRELLLNNNSLRVLPCELGRLYQLHSLGISGNPLSQDILTMVKEPNGTGKLLTFLLDNLTVCPRPPEREWVTVVPPLHRSRLASPFIVMSYNILCDKYATRAMYGYCPSWALSWEYRKQAILKEIVDSMADIVALQEVETEQFYQYLQPELRRVGYEGIFSPKSRAKTMPDLERKHVDGCAIFFHTGKFSLVEHHLIELNQSAMNHAEGSEAMLNRVMPRDNICLTAFLEFKDPNVASQHQLPQHILIVNAHIHWDPEFCDVKLIQMIMLMNELEGIINKVQSERGIGGQTAIPGLPGVPILLCGDLNSLPQSGVVEYLGKGSVSTTHRDFLQLSYRRFFDSIQSMSSLNGSKSQITHPFRFKNSFGEENLVYTNYTYDFKGIIDYVFYSGDFLQPIGIMNGVSIGWLSQYRVIGCPNPHFPSDHFPLCCEYELINPPTLA